MQTVRARIYSKVRAKAGSLCRCDRVLAVAYETNRKRTGRGAAVSMTVFGAAWRSRGEMVCAGGLESRLIV